MKLIICLLFGSLSLVGCGNTSDDAQANANLAQVMPTIDGEADAVRVFAQFRDHWETERLQFTATEPFQQFLA